MRVPDLLSKRIKNNPDIQEVLLDLVERYHPSYVEMMDEWKAKQSEGGEK